MKSKLSTLLALLLLSSLLHAQWEVGFGPGVSIPITGYEQVLKSGWLLNAEGKCRFKKGNFAVGLKAHFARLQNDKNPADSFQNARMTIAPILLIVEYRIRVKGKLEPYVSGGLGVSLFSLNYDTSPTTGKSVFNVSFTMVPVVGLNYYATQKIYPFAEWGLVLLSDGPPIGFPKADRMTGYNSIVAGVKYKF
jgi:outer membrane protein with beta-barrel domain